MSILLRMVEGFTLAADTFTTPRKYPRVVRGGFHRDADKLRHDVERIGSDATAVLATLKEERTDRDGKPTYASAGGFCER